MIKPGNINNITPIINKIIFPQKNLARKSARAAKEKHASTKSKVPNMVIMIFIFLIII